MHPGRAQGGHAPKHRAGNDERLAGKAVSEPAGGRRGKHVEEKERGGEPAHLLVRGVELALDERDFAGEDVAVDVVEEVEADEQDQCPQSGVGLCAERL